jgi:hypothetical protein
MIALQKTLDQERFCDLLDRIIDGDPQADELAVEHVARCLARGTLPSTVAYQLAAAIAGAVQAS